MMVFAPSPAAMFCAGALAIGLSYANAALTDSLDDLSNFGPALNSTLLSLPAGEASLISDAPSVDRLVDWQIGGTIPLDLIDEGLLEVTPTNQILAGEWGLWVLYYSGTGTFLDETNILPFTTSNTAFSKNINDTAPQFAEKYVLRFRIREAIGDGFSFTQINATSVPEPSSLMFALAGLACLARRQRN